MYVAWRGRRLLGVWRNLDFCLHLCLRFVELRFLLDNSAFLLRSSIHVHILFTSQSAFSSCASIPLFHTSMSAITSFAPSFVASTSICIRFISLLRNRRVEKCLSIPSGFPVFTMVFVLPMLILSCVTLISRFAPVASIFAVFARAENQDLKYTYNGGPNPSRCHCQRCHFFCELCPVH